jgi:molybdate transport system substrate-binding protein
VTTARRSRFLAVLAFAVLAGCSPAGVSAPPSNLTLSVAAAASLKDAFTEAASAYKASHPGVAVQLAFDASSTLRTQIEQGAPVDVFASADTTNPQQLVDHGLATGPVRPIARNQLVIVVPHRADAIVASPQDLARSGVKVIAAGSEVPITKYATQLVANLARQPGYPADYAARVAANIVSREDNVRAILAKVALGEGDAGIVYVTDARAADVGTVDVLPGANVVATYGAVVTRGSSHPAEAAAFVDWLASPDGQAVLGRFGFLPAAG